MEAYAEDSFGPDGRQTPQSRPRILGGLLTMTGSGVSNQIGAGIGAHAFPALGPAGVVAVRQLVAAAVLLPGPSSDFLGIGIAAAGAACWAAYIILNRMVGQRLPGLQGSAVATLVSMVFYLPVAAYLLSAGALTGPALLLSVIAGVLCSVIPYAADLIALRHVRLAFFGVYMSINPLLAAFSGMIVLGQVLALHEWLGIVLIVATNAAAILLADVVDRVPAGEGRAHPRWTIGQRKTAE